MEELDLDSLSLVSARQDRWQAASTSRQWRPRRPGRDGRALSGATAHGAGLRSGFTAAERSGDRRGARRASQLRWRVEKLSSLAITREGRPSDNAGPGVITLPIVRGQETLEQIPAEGGLSGRWCSGAVTGEGSG